MAAPMAMPLIGITFEPSEKEANHESAHLSRSRRKAWEIKPDPTIIDSSDAIVRIDSSTICGTDLHILEGDVPKVTPGTVLGHEAVGTILETGPP